MKLISLIGTGHPNRKPILNNFRIFKIHIKNLFPRLIDLKHQEASIPKYNIVVCPNSKERIQKKELSRKALFYKLSHKSVIWVHGPVGHGDWYKNLSDEYVRPLMNRSYYHKVFKESDKLFIKKP